jgi:hypothetical protein
MTTAILENQLRAITPELMAGSIPNFYRYIYLLGIFYGFFTRGEHYGPGHFIMIMTMRYSLSNVDIDSLAFALYDLLPVPT